EIAVRAVNPKQLGQLTAGEEQGNATLEPDHHAFGDEVDDRAGSDQPGNKEQDRDEHRGSRRENAEPARIAAGNSAEGCAGEQGDGGRDCYRRVPRTTKQPEDHSAKQAGVESCFWWEVGQRRVAEPGRQKIGRESEAGYEVGAKPSGFVVAEPDRRLHESGKTARAYWCGVGGDRFVHLLA